MKPKRIDVSAPRKESAPFVARVEVWPVTRLQALDRNPRVHSDDQIDEICESIRRFGFLAPPVIDETRGIVLAGNGRLVSAIKLGLSEIPVIPVGHLSEAEQKAYVVADNQIALHATWDNAILAEYFAEIEKLGLDVVGSTFFSQDEIDAIINEYADANAIVTEDEAPEPPEHAVTVRGDVWRLNDHLVLCGDATKIEDVRRVCAMPAAMCFTDVPYDIDYRGCARDAIENTQRKPIANDDLGADYEGFLAPVIENILASTAGASYVCIGQQRAHTLREVWLSASGHVSTILIWAKSHFVLGGGDYNPRYEMIAYGWRDGGAHPWYGGEGESNVWEIDKPAANPHHPTQKPVELVARAVRNSSRRGETVLDVCAGSGTTLIACEQLGRKAACVEIDPSYVDVIIERWQALSGEDAIHDATGKSFTEIAEERRAAPCR